MFVNEIQAVHMLAFCCMCGLAGESIVGFLFGAGFCLLLRLFQVFVDKFGHIELW